MSNYDYLNPKIVLDANGAPVGRVLKSDDGKAAFEAPARTLIPVDSVRRILEDMLALESEE